MMLDIKNLDFVLLKDGRKGTVIFIYTDYALLVEFQQNDYEWEQEDVLVDQITEILFRPN